MTFVIKDSQIATYQSGINAIIDQLGKWVIAISPPKYTMCPNCKFDASRGRSSGIYKTDNPNPSGPLNKPFAAGQVCPVCQGAGKIQSSQNRTQFKATTLWNPKEDYYTDNAGKTMMFPDGTCKIKSYITYFDAVKNADSFEVAYDEQTVGSPNYVRCKLLTEPTPRGLKESIYFVAYLKRDT